MLDFKCLHTFNITFCRNIDGCHGYTRNYWTKMVCRSVLATSSGTQLNLTVVSFTGVNITPVSREHGLLRVFALVFAWWWFLW